MHDQANDLRRLVRDCAATEAYAIQSRPNLAMIASGKGGVGTTTIAVNLAVAAARAGLQTVLVDADQDGGDVGILCGLQERYTIADALSGRRTVSEVLRPGPVGLRVLPGVWGLERLSDYPAAAAKRLLGQINCLGNPADLVVLDAGNGLSNTIRPLWQAADLILQVTTAEVPSIIDTYAAIKTLLANENVGQIHALVNRAPNVEVAQNVQGRLARACRRFLGIQLKTAGHISNDQRVTEAESPFVITAPDCDAARQIQRLAEALPAADAQTGIHLPPNQLECPSQAGIPA